MAQHSGAPTIVGSLIIGLTIVVSALLIRSAIETATEEVAGLNAALERGEFAVAKKEPSRPGARPSRPDPNRRYAVATTGSPVRGNAKAKVAVIEFSDFQCPFCGRVTPTLDQIEKEYGSQVRIVFKHLPLRIHPKAPAAHAAAEAAHRQGKFWEMHDRIFAAPRDLNDESYVAYAKEIGLDVARFNNDRASAEVKKKVDADVAEAQRLGVTGTPAFFVNGKFVSGAQPFSTFKALIDQELGRG